jgi:hypothetical protein
MIVLLSFSAGRTAGAQEPTFPKKFTLYPMAAPRPALKYKLLPPYTERKPGNAAVYYGKVTAEATRYFVPERDEEFERLHTAPLAEVAGQRFPTGSVEMLEGAARCDSCDWQLPLRESRDPASILLPEVSQTRTFARLMAVKARMHVANGEFERAVHALQTGYALGQHVAKGQTVVNALVGLRHCEMMNRQVATFVQQPGAPNLYWALSQLPNPLVDLTDALEFDRTLIESSFPFVRELETKSYNAEECQRALHRLARLLDATHGGPFSVEKFEEAAREFQPSARQAMVERGLTRAFVNAMSAHQVILVHAARVYQEQFDQGTKQFAMTYPQAMTGLDAAVEQADRERTLIPLGLQTLKRLRNVRTSIARTEREISVLRFAESLRLYAAGHDGRLPASLTEIKEVPIPLDPVTSAPFEYRVEEGRAVIAGPPMADGPTRWEFAIVRP